MNLRETQIEEEALGIAYLKVRFSLDSFKEAVVRIPKDHHLLWKIEKIEKDLQHIETVLKWEYEESDG